MAGKFTSLLLMRHGDTIWTREGRYQGRSDVPLSKAGIAQAQAASKRIQKWRPDVIFSSPLIRAKATAEKIAAVCKKKVQWDIRLKEVSFGRWEGKTAAQLIREKDKSYSQWLKGHWVKPEGGESVPHLRRRVREFLKQTLRLHEGRKVLVVAHGGPVKAILLDLLEIPFRNFWMFRVQTGSFSLIEVDRHFAQLVFLNDRSHIKNGQPL